MYELRRYDAGGRGGDDRNCSECKNKRNPYSNQMTYQDLQSVVFNMILCFSHHYKTSTIRTVQLDVLYCTSIATDRNNRLTVMQCQRTWY